MKKVILTAALMAIIFSTGFAQNTQTQRTTGDTLKTKLKENDKRDKEKVKTEGGNKTKDKRKDKIKDRDKNTIPAIDTSSPLGILNQPG